MNIIYYQDPQTLMSATGVKRPVPATEEFCLMLSDQQGFHIYAPPTMECRQLHLNIVKYFLDCFDFTVMSEEKKRLLAQVCVECTEIYHSVESQRQRCQNQIH